MALTTVSSDRLSTNVKNTNFTAAEKQDLTDDILPLAGQLGNRNLIINGAFQVAQRGTSSTSNGYYTVDRFKINDGGVDEATTKEQVAVTSGGAYDSGFRNCLKITNGNQTSGAGASDYVQILHRVEAQNMANSGWNYTSSSSSITLQFWVKSSVAQAFSGSLRTADGTAYQYKFDTPSLSADTWTKVTKTIPGNSNLTFDNNNDVGLELYLFPFIGTTYTTSNSNTETWITGAGDTYANDMTSTWWTTNDATFEITGVQLEVGSVATDFEHRSFALEERLCQRYYFRQSAEHQYTRYACHGQCPSANGAQFVYPLPVKMRAAPTLAYSALSDFFIYASNLQSKTPTSLAMDSSNTVSPMFNAAKSSTFTAGTMAHLTAPNALQGY